MRRRFFLAVSLLSLAPCVGSASAQDRTPRQPAPSHSQQAGGAEVLALEQKIEEAVVRGDVTFVDRVTASDFSFVHGDGWTTGGRPLMSDDKAAFLKRVADKEYLVHDLDSVKVEIDRKSTRLNSSH